MILISGLFELAEKDVGTMKAAATKMAIETRKENGCRVYAFYQDIENPKVFRIFEEWDSDEALKAHFEAPHMAVFRETLAAATVVSRNVTKYEISNSSPLG